MRARLFALILSSTPALACAPAAPPSGPVGATGSIGTTAGVDATGSIGTTGGVGATGSIGTIAGVGATGGVGAKLPAVPLIDLARAPRSVEGIRAGRVALVTFWATWCDACQKEMPALNRLDERTTGDHGVVIGVAVGEPSAKVRGFVEKHGLRYTQLVDEDFRLTDALGQKRLPATLVLNRAGAVVFTGGALDADALAAYRAALNEDRE